MSIVLTYIGYRKDLDNYCQNKNEIYRMIPYIKESIDTILAIKLYGFFDEKYGLTLKELLTTVKTSITEKKTALSDLEKELSAFEKNNNTKQSIIRIRHCFAHINQKDKPESISISSIEILIEFIKNFINKLHKLSGLSTAGYIYTSEMPYILHGCA